MVSVYCFGGGEDLQLAQQVTGEEGLVLVCPALGLGPGPGPSPMPQPSSFVFGDFGTA
jgi:hypothetical protein